MRNFSLKNFLNGQKVVTRSNKEVTELTYFKTAVGQITLAGVIDGSLLTWHESGFWSAIENKETDLDLFHPDEYVVIINKGYREVWDEVFTTKADAERFIDLKGLVNAEIHRLA